MCSLATVVILLEVTEFLWRRRRRLNTMARILESGLNLVHPYSRNKSDKEDGLFLLLFLIHDICCNNCEIDMFLPIITSPYNIQYF